MRACTPRLLLPIHASSQNCSEKKGDLELADANIQCPANKYQYYFEVHVSEDNQNRMLSLRASSAHVSGGLMHPARSYV